MEVEEEEGGVCIGCVKFTMGLREVRVGDK